MVSVVLDFESDDPLIKASVDRLKMAAIADEDTNVRNAAVAGLLKILLKHWETIYIYMPLALREVGSVAVEKLVLLLKDDQPYHRKIAATTLGMICDVAAVEPLISALQKEKESFVKKDLIIALGMIGDTRAIEALSIFLMYEFLFDEWELQRTAEQIFSLHGWQPAAYVNMPVFEIVRAIGGHASQAAHPKDYIAKLKAEDALALVKIAETGAYPTGAENALHHILMHYSPDIATDVLRSIVHLPDKISITVSVEFVGKIADTKDYTVVKQLAEKELINRGQSGK